MKELQPIFCGDAAKNLVKKKKNEDDFVFLDAVKEGKFCRTFQILAPL